MTDHKLLVEQVTSLLAGQNDLVANAANLSSLLFHSLDNVNWVGFYFLKGDELIVGPFQGRPACVAIPLGRGVCGTSAETCQVLRVADVHAFQGHIVCDLASRSEIAVPLVRDEILFGVLDLDSPVTDRFDQDDEIFLIEIASIFINSLG
jgi:L-methionine (R)-S-oxide reductase